MLNSTIQKTKTNYIKIQKSKRIFSSRYSRLSWLLLDLDIVWVRYLRPKIKYRKILLIVKIC